MGGSPPGVGGDGGSRSQQLLTGGRPRNKILNRWPAGKLPRPPGVGGDGDQLHSSRHPSNKILNRWRKRDAARNEILNRWRKRDAARNKISNRWAEGHQPATATGMVEITVAADWGRRRHHSSNRWPEGNLASCRRQRPEGSEIAEFETGNIS